VKRRSPGTKRERLVYVVVATTLVLVAGISVFFAGLQRLTEDPTDVTPDGSAATRPIPMTDPDTFVLFYVAQDGLGLVTREHKITPAESQDAEARARQVAEAQLGEAPAPLASPFPDGTRVQAIYLTPTGDAFVDLSLEVSRGHQGGSLDELLTVYALVNALTTNVPEISAVQILVDGREVDTLAGHVDLRRPLPRDMKWVTDSSETSESSSETETAETG
jgi:hypothetical protein